MPFRINQLTQHRPTKQPQYYKNHEFAQYLAGVIDARGQFTDDGGVELQYRLRDTRNAYALRSLLGYGKVRIKTQKGVCRAILRIDGILGFREVSLNIHGNLRNPKRIQEFNHIFYEKLKYIRIPTPSNQPIEWDSPWLAGLADGSGSYLNVIMRWDIHRRKHQARISFEITLDNQWVLKQIKTKFGGYVVQSKVQKGLYHYSTVAGKFKTIYKMIQYFDKFPPQYHFFYLRYTAARKAWLILQQEKYFHPRRTRGLTELGMNKMMAVCHPFITSKRRLNPAPFYNEKDF